MGFSTLILNVPNIQGASLPRILMEGRFFQRFGSTKVNSLKVGELTLILRKGGELLSILLILEKLKSIY